MGRRLAAVLLSGAVFVLAAAGGARCEILSIAPEQANVREGPGRRRPVLWKAWRFSPMLVLDWVGDWAKVRDQDGDDGWVHGSVLADTAAVIVITRTAKVREGPGAGYRAAWTVETGYPFKVLEVDGPWVRVTDEEDVKGWVLRKSVWGRTRLEKAST